jgi:type IV secretory pathway component VirB8
MKWKMVRVTKNKWRRKLVLEAQDIMALLITVLLLALVIIQELR